MSNLTKEECLQALKCFTFCALRDFGNTKYDEKTGKLILKSRKQKQHDVLLQLINEHFDNPPKKPHVDNRL